MLPFRKILFPTDYSEGCQAVVPFVTELTRHFAADLTLIHAYALRPAFLVRSPDGALVYDETVAMEPGWPNEMRALEEKRLRTYATATFPGQYLESAAQEGEPGTVIHRFIQHQGADLVMIPTRGLGPIRRLLLGSVTAKVLHDASVPVWTSVGHPLAGHQPQASYKSIVCALDNCDEASAILTAAAFLACSYNARLSLVRVVETLSTACEVDLGPYRKKVLDSAEIWLRELKASQGIDAPHSVIEATTADGVREEVVRRKADLLVVGRGHSQGALASLWSSLYQIVCESPCPVLSI